MAPGAGIDRQPGSPGSRGADRGLFQVDEPNIGQAVMDRVVGEKSEGEPRTEPCYHM